MEHLTNLRDLNVMNNMLEWLPWQLCHCKSLKILSFDGNYIEKIPHQLIQHQGLVEISASRNKLRSIPQGIYLQITMIHYSNYVFASEIIIAMRHS